MEEEMKVAFEGISTRDCFLEMGVSENRCRFFFVSLLSGKSPLQIRVSRASRNYSCLVVIPAESPFS